MFGVGQGEVLLILLAVLILFGAKRIPEVARSIGKGMSDIRSTMSSLEHEIRSGPPPGRDPAREDAKLDEGEVDDPTYPPSADNSVPEEPGQGRDLSG